MDRIICASRNEYVVLSECCPERPYIEVQVPADATSVEEIALRITSHDQGFCDDKALIGRGGFTWCELNIATPTGRSNIARKFIYYNISGKPEWHKGHKRWKKTDKANEEVLGAIQAGDIVQVIPKARFKGWVNHIRDMELEVHITTSSESKEIRNKDDGVPKPNYDLLDANKKHIRLLALLPGTSPDPVAVKLLSGRPLEDTSTQFEALSYVWGNISNKETIELHQHDTTIAVSISSGLYGALLHLRNPVSTRTLWIDQLCINQSDTNELAYQVSMMGEIYARASNVIVWLGHGSEHTRIAVEAVQAVLSKFTSPNLDSGFGPITKELLPHISNSGHQISRDDEHISAHEFLLGSISRVLSIPWFWRTWVLQEAWLAKSVVFWYENITIEWESLARANHWVTKYGYFLPTLQQTNLPRLWGNLGDLQRQHQERSKSNPLNLKKPLLELVWQGLDLKASDPRDKIFGLFGLAEETHPDQLSKLENRLIYPDYTKNVSNVWSDFTWWWINRYQSLKILGVVHANHGRTWQSVHCTANEGVTSHDQPPHDHPSWALWHTGKAKWVSKGLDFSSRYSASGATKTILGSRSPNALSDVSGFSLLRLKGLRLGTIRSTEPFSWKDKSHELCMTFERLFDFSGDRRLYNSPVTIPDEFDLKRWELGHFAVHHRISEITSLQQLPQLPCLDDCSISLDGGLRGLCPSGTKGGDVVVILYGGSVPYVLREKEGGDGWQFVGECYVEGMMRGEALERAEGDRIQEEWFVLV